MIKTEEEYHEAKGKLKSAVEKLAELGSTIAIANELIWTGIKGLPGCSRVCPLAKYFERKIGFPVVVRNSYLMIDGAFIWEAGKGNNAIITLPGVLSTFINEVDGYDYPELIAHKEEI